MPVAGFEFHDGGLYWPRLGLWMDPHEPRTGPEKVFISHAHSDHVAAHCEIILSAPTAKLMRARVPGERREHVLDFGETRRFKEEASFDLTLLPAGHIFGSAMALLETQGQSWLYTGDFKLRPGLSAERCEPRHAEALIMETTFGRPHYVFPPTKEVLGGVIRFCEEALRNDETPVLLGYSLGKSQELLCGLGAAGLPLVLHGSIYQLTQIYEQFGQCFPKYEPYERGTARGKVLLCPPNAAGSALVRNLGNARTAILTGWAVDPNCRYRYQCDAAFPLSDHADFPELVELVKRVAPKRIYTLHGFAAEFAHTLRGLGFEAQALSQDEQLALPLYPEERQTARRAAPVAPQVIRRPVTEPESDTSPSPKESFGRFAAVCGRIGAQAGKLEKIRILGEYLGELRGEGLAQAATWFTGRPFAASGNQVLKLGWATLRDAACSATGVDGFSFHQVYLKHSDLGETVAEILERRPGPGTLSLEAVAGVFQRLQAARGPLAKVPILKAALEQCGAAEAKYLVKIITGDLRIGLKEGLVEEAIAKGFGRPASEVRQANLRLGDLGQTARLASEDRLREIELVSFRPVKFMLASPEPSAVAVLERVRQSEGANGPAPIAEAPAATPQVDGSAAVPAWVEEKYDGVRCQLHKAGQRVALYSRDLKDITATFEELAEACREMPRDFILDGEVVAMRGEQVLPFAELQKRLGRREGDLFMRVEAPVALIAFDCLQADGTVLLDRALQERRSVLESLGPWPAPVQVARVVRVHSVAELEQAFDEAQARGNEGLVIKDPSSPYTPGRRGFAWLKLKKALATLDCVVVGAEYGHGKRNKVLSDYTFAVRDPISGELKTIGKAYSGLTDEEIAHLTEHFLQNTIRRHGRYLEVVPDTVLEIAFDRVQPSDRHGSGLALRFPRIARIRTDKTVQEIDTVESARKLINRRTLKA